MSSPRRARTRIFSRYATLEAGQAFCTDVKIRLAKYGRRPDQLLILPAATFTLAETDAEAEELAKVLAIALIVHCPDPITGFRTHDHADRVRRPYQPLAEAWSRR